MTKKSKIFAKIRDSLNEQSAVKTATLENVVMLANEGDWQEVFAKEKELVEDIKKQILDGTFDVAMLPVIRELIPDSSPNALSDLFNNSKIARKLQKLVGDYYGTDKVYVGDYKLDSEQECPYKIIVGDVIPYQINQDVCLPNTLLVFGSIDGYYNPEKSKVRYALSANIETHKSTGDLRCLTKGLWTQRYHGPTLSDRTILWGSLSLENMEYLGGINYLSSKLQDTDKLKFCGTIQGDSHYPSVFAEWWFDDKTKYKNTFAKTLKEFSRSNKDAINLESAMKAKYHSTFKDKMSCVMEIIQDTRQEIKSKRETSEFNWKF